MWVVHMGSGCGYICAVGVGGGMILGIHDKTHTHKVVGVGVGMTMDTPGYTHSIP